MKEVKKITVKIIHQGKIVGTGFFIDKQKIITSKHVLQNSCEKIIIRTCLDRIDRKAEVIYIAEKEDEKFDIAILKLTSEVEYNIDLFNISNVKMKNGFEWETYGYPEGSEETGAKFYGKINDYNVIGCYEDEYFNIKLSCESYYKWAGTINSLIAGLSGAPVVVNNDIIGIIRYERDKELGAIGFSELKSILEKNNITYESKTFWRREFEKRQLEKLGLIIKNTKIKVNREHLDKNIMEYVQKDSGLIIGSAGIGKTYTASILVEKLMHNNIPAFFVDLNENSDIDYSKFLKLFSIDGMNIDEFMDYHFGSKGIVLFDGFDTIKDSNTRSGFISFLNILKKELNNRLNIIVIVRKYDVEYSTQLWKLFSENEKTEFSDITIKSRNFIIPFLSIEEIEANIKEKVVDTTVIKSIQELLKLPFFLNIFINIYNDTIKITEIKTEFGLIEEFWKQKIIECGIHSIENAIKNITIETTKLKNSYLIEKLIFSFEDSVWNNILSSNLIFQKGNSIGFSHKLFYEYFLGKFGIDNLENYFIKNEFNALYNMQSIQFYFEYLWVHNKSTFWEEFKFLTENNKYSIFTLLAFKTYLLNSIKKIEIEEINQIITEKNELYIKTGLANNLVFYFKHIDINEAWILYISEYLSYEKPYFFNAIQFLCMTIEKNEIKDILKKEVEKISLDNLKKLWEQKEEINGNYIISAIQLFLSAYNGASLESEEMIEKILSEIGSKNFNIRYIDILIREEKNILKYNFKTIQFMYLKLFNTEEKSEEKTYLVYSSVMPMTSTKKQDFAMCRYSLMTHIPLLLEKFDLEFARVLFQIVNTLIITNHILPHSNKNFKFENRLKEFEIGSKKYYYYEDLSFIWGNTNYRESELLKIMDILIEYINKKIIENESYFDKILAILNENENAAFIWGILIRNLRISEIEKISEIFLNKEMLSDNNFIDIFKKIIPKLDNESILKIEKIIIQLEEPRQQKYFSNIKEHIKTDEGKEVLENINVKEYIDSQEFEMTTGFSKYSVFEEDERNTNLSQMEIQLINNMKIIEDFNSKTSEEAYIIKAEEINIIRETIFYIDKEIEFRKINNKFLLNTSLKNITSAILRILKNDLSNETNIYLEKYLVICMKINEYEIETNIQEKETNIQEKEINIKSPIKYEVTHRTNLASIMFILYINKQSNKIFKVIRKTLETDNMIIKFRISSELWRLYYKNKKKFWMLFDILNLENDFRVNLGLLNSMMRVIQNYDYYRKEYLRKYMRNKQGIDKILKEKYFIRLRLKKYFSGQEDLEFTRTLIKNKRKICEFFVNGRNYIESEVFFNVLSKKSPSSKPVLRKWEMNC